MHIFSLFFFNLISRYLILTLMRKYLVLVLLLSFFFLLMVLNYFIYTLLHGLCLLRYMSLQEIWSVSVLLFVSLLVVFVHLNEVLQSNSLNLLASEATIIDSPLWKFKLETIY